MSSDSNHKKIRWNIDLGAGILSGSSIKQAITSGLIDINPYDERLVNPSSIDLRLGAQIRVYRAVTEPVDQDLRIESKDGAFACNSLDAKIDNAVRTIELKPGERIQLRPGVGYLMHTLETVHTDHFVSVVDGKSSLGRLFLCAHQTSGYVDPGFIGQITLEVSVIHPVWIYAGQRIAQLRFHTIVGPIDLYKGHYRGQAAQGAVPSKANEQIAEDK